MTRSLRRRYPLERFTLGALDCECARSRSVCVDAVKSERRVPFCSVLRRWLSKGVGVRLAFWSPRFSLGRRRGVRALVHGRSKGGYLDKAGWLGGGRGKRALVCPPARPLSGVRGVEPEPLVVARKSGGLVGVGWKLGKRLGVGGTDSRRYDGGFKPMLGCSPVCIIDTENIAFVDPCERNRRWINAKGSEGVQGFHRFSWWTQGGAGGLPRRDQQLQRE
jgi:hypothetical protein